MPITYGMNLSKLGTRTPERHRPDEGLHNPQGGIGGVRVVPAHRQSHRMEIGL